MARKCAYCGKTIREFDAVCPNCGRIITGRTSETPYPEAPTAQEAPPPAAEAPRPATVMPTEEAPPPVPVMPAAEEPRREGPPRTIEELQAFAERHHLPLDKMRFHIGEDFRDPRAFGIYESDGRFIVYKNKSDGTRAVRYDGPDEAFAVSELYQKMMSEVDRQSARQAPPPPRQPAGRSRKTPWFLWVIIAVVLASFLMRCVASDRPQRGYYNLGGSYYYSQGGDWYLYDDYYGWYEVDLPEYYEDFYPEFYVGDEYYDYYGAEDFYDSGYYEDDWYWDSDDDDWDWDSDWDSGWTDWDSDW